MAEWRVMELKGFRPFVKLENKDSVCGTLRGIVRDRKYEGQTKVVIESVNGILFEIRAGVLLDQYFEVFGRRLYGEILTIAQTGKIDSCMSYRVGFWVGTLSEFVENKDNLPVIERTAAHIADAQGSQGKKT